MNQTGTENRGIDPEIFNMVYGFQEWSPMFLTLGFRFTYLGPGTAGIKMIPRAGYSSFAGRVNGGIIAALADNVMGMAAITLGNIVRTVDLNINYVAPAFEENEITAEAQVISAGNTLIIVEASLLNAGEKLVARSRGTFIKDAKFGFAEYIHQIGPGQGP